MTHYLILGSGAAGISAAEAIRRSDAEGSITLLSEEAEGYYSRPGLAYYLSGEINPQQLFPFSEKDFEQRRLERITGRAQHIRPKEHRVELEDQRSLPYDRLLIASGSSAVRVRAPGAQAQGVVKLDNLADARQILKWAHKARSAVVVGGGITALEIVEGLVSRKVKTHYFLRGERYWSNVLDAGESRLIEHLLKKDGVELHHHTELAEVLEKNGRVCGVLTAAGRQVTCQLVAISIGVQPRKELAVAAGLETERGILVNPYLQTADNDIFAAGDVAQVLDPLTGKAAMDTLWGTARAQGTTAGLNMAGHSTQYRKGVPFNVTRLAGLTTTILGAVGTGRDEDLTSIARGDSETWRKLPDAIAAQAGFEANRLRVLVGESHILGAVVMGDQMLSRPLQRLVTHQVDIQPIRQQLLAPGAPIASILADFYSAWQQKSG